MAAQYLSGRYGLHQPKTPSDRAKARKQAAQASEARLQRQDWLDKHSTCANGCGKPVAFWDETYLSLRHNGCCSAECEAIHEARQQQAANEPADQANHQLTQPVFSAPSVEVITADVADDEHAIKVFLDGFARMSPHTVRSYEKECHRFLLWLRATRRAAPALLPTVRLEDINDYLAFLEKPRPFAADFLAAHGWEHQPFRKPLASASIKHCITVLHKLFSVMRELRAAGDEPYCKFNPVKVAHQGISGVKAQVEIEQAFSPIEWQAVLDAIENLPRDKPRDVRHYHRARWIFQLLYRAYLRRDEAASLTMGSFEPSPEGWSIRLVGKGNKPGKIVATNKLMAELRVYRESLGLPPLPSHGEDRPAIMAVTGENKGITAQAIYLICGEIFEQAKDLLESRGDSAGAARMSQASPHWMRHTGVTHALEAGVNPRYVQAQARHSSLNVTATYDHKDRRAWRGALDQVDI